MPLRDLVVVGLVGDLEHPTGHVLLEVFVLVVAGEVREFVGVPLEVRPSVGREQPRPFSVRLSTQPVSVSVVVVRDLKQNILLGYGWNALWIFDKTRSVKLRREPATPIVDEDCSIRIRMRS